MTRFIFGVILGAVFITIVTIVDFSIEFPKPTFVNGVEDATAAVVGRTTFKARVLRA